MTSQSQGNWKWHFIHDPDRETFGPAPEAMDPETEPVKITGARGVFRKHGCFVKIYLTPGKPGLFRILKNAWFPKARNEFQTLCELQKHCIPAVEPVAWGQAGAHASGLITREIPDCVSAGDYFHRAIGEENRDCPEFLTGWCCFVRDFLRSGFDHPDFHNGNILYRELDHSFFLVDVYGVRRKSRPDTRKMAMIVREFAGFLPKKELLRLLENCGIPDPAAFYPEMIRYGAKMIRHEFPRRLAQLQQNYPKFIKKEGDLCRNLNGAREPIPLENTVPLQLTPEQAANARAMDLFLALCNIPRLRIAAFEAPGTLYVEPLSGDLPAHAESDLQERLQLCGLDPADFFLTADRFGRAVVVPNIYNI